MGTLNSNAKISKNQVISENVKNILLSLGENINRDVLLETPNRVAKAYAQIFSGYGENPKEILSKQFDQSCQGKVIVKNIEFYSMCEHHFLPFFGNVDIEYVPRSNRIVGLSKLVRLVECYSKRLQIQEKLTREIAQAIFDNISCKHVKVRIRAEHLCMKMRGVKNQNSVAETEHEVFCERGEDNKSALTTF
ncbi:MAG: GTP cyclohydrolase I FolE [Oscillospiraceae bacterium]|jgi:GTP cyclohydrolase I|nr:GTP cyclohydrolase I FolE [Oscillospiraceae bacterium]